MFDEVQFAINRERQWREHRGTKDCGSYCEEQSQEAALANRIIAAYKEISNCILELERCGLKPAKFPQAQE